MKKIIPIIGLIILALSTYLYLKNGITRFDLPKGELKWSNKRPQNAKMCIPAAFTDGQGQILGAYRINGKIYEANKTMIMRVSLKGGMFFISRKWMGDNGFQQLTLVNNSKKRIAYAVLFFYCRALTTLPYRIPQGVTAPRCLRPTAPLFAVSAAGANLLNGGDNRR